MKNTIESTAKSMGRKSSYAGIIVITAILVQLVIDMIYSGQL